MLLYAVGGLVFFPCDAPDSEGVNAARRPLTPCYNGGPNRATGDSSR